MSDSYGPMDYSLPGFSVHRILQAKILEGVAIFFTRGSESDCLFINLFMQTEQIYCFLSVALSFSFFSPLLDSQDSKSTWKKRVKLKVSEVWILKN